MKRSSKAKKISELLSDFFQNKKLENREVLNPLKLWQEIMGVHIKSETKNLYIDKKILYIEINNTYLKSDLISQQSNILKKIQTLNKNIINVVFI
ncbi:MAG: hypothetical protein CMD23_02350 [Flavobacteriales bacterium]|nr:hypothetical protein [Flavobacteriales bacterium]|tara:strand:+ start:247 stop:531 length:285 start_codon:yes stop_codon:yes gene_type:complete